MPRPPARSAHLTVRIPVSLDERIDKLAEIFQNSRSRVAQAALMMGVRDLEHTLELVADTPEDIQEEFAELTALGDIEGAVRLWNKREAERVSA